MFAHYRDALTRAIHIALLTRALFEGAVGLRLTTDNRDAEQLVAQGVERDVVGALLGHTPDSITTLHYAPVTWREMVAAINRLDYSELDPGFAR